MPLVASRIAANGTASRWLSLGRIVFEVGMSKMSRPVLSAQGTFLSNAIGGLSIVNNAPIKVLTVDAHSILRDGIRAALARQPDMILAAEATSGQEAIEKFRRFLPDITLMDLRLPDMTGIDAILAIRASFPVAKIVVLSTFSGPVQASRAFKAGARGYLLKSMLREDLLDTIRQVHAGRRRIPKEVAEEMAVYVCDELTVRELQVLGEVALGNSNRMIASKLSITEDTVKGHVKNILSKLAANDRTHAVTIAVRRGEIYL